MSKVGYSRHGRGSECGGGGGGDGLGAGLGVLLWL